MDPSPSFMTLRTRRPANDGSSTNMSSADSAYGSVTDGSSPPATHDISRVSYHVKHIDTFAQALQDSASRAFPNRDRAAQRYTKVHALMLHWKSDDLFVLPELEDLEKCFRDHYCFETDIFSIPSENPHLELMLKIGDMVKQHEADGTLFIVYYGGHARIDDSRQSTWCANRRPGSPWLQWSAIQTLLERSVSDVMILLDCCAGAASATFPTGKTITETISASSWDAIAPDPGRYSFTNALIEVLEEWRQRTFSAAMLHAEILARLKHPRPILINGKHFEARSTPVHFMMTSNHKAPSIELCRLVPSTRLPPSPRSEMAYWHSQSDARAIEGRHQIEQYPSDPYNSEPNEDEPHVLISLALEGDQKLDFDAWETWLAEFPALAKYVKIQGAFKSHSSLLLLSLPVMVWDFLPDDPACSFISFIRSNNLLQGQKPSSAPPDSHVPVTSEAPVSSSMHDDAESHLSGTTYGPTENTYTVRRENSGSNISRTPSTASAPYQEQPASPRLSLRAGAFGGIRPEYSSPDLLSTPGPSTQPTIHASPLRNVASTTSLGTLSTLERYQPTPRALSAAASSGLPTPSEGIARTAILNRTRSSKKSVYRSDQNVPEGQAMAPHVVRLLEDYFQRDSDPSIAVLEHLASNLGVETSDVHVWFYHRREQERMTYNLQNLRIDAHLDQARDVARMVLPGHLSSLLEIYPSKGILVVDLRSSTDFERSHVHDAINLRAPLGFVENTSLEMIEDTVMDYQSRRSFSKWSQCKAVVFYDRVIEFDWECPVADALYTKFRRKGWHGECFILKGHYREFSSSFDKYISGSKMTSEAKEYIDNLRQQSSPSEEEANRRDERYEEWLHAFTSQHRVPTVDLIPARKLERRSTVEQHQKELESEFEARFPALYRKAKAMGSTPALDDLPSPSPPSPPPPFDSDPQQNQDFRNVNWAGAGREGDDHFELRKAPLVEHLTAGLEMMRAAGDLAPASSRPSPQGYGFDADYGGKRRMDLYADDYDHDYDEIDPKSEELGNHLGFQEAGVGGAAESGSASGETTLERRGGEDTLNMNKKAAKKKPQIWERLRSGGSK